jgi:hypothetical protein
MILWRFSVFLFFCSNFSDDFDDDTCGFSPPNSRYQIPDTAIPTHLIRNLGI